MHRRSAVCCGVITTGNCGALCSPSRCGARLDGRTNGAHRARYRLVDIYDLLNGFKRVPDEIAAERGVPGSICASGVETNWNKRSGRWREARSIVRNR